MAALMLCCLIFTLWYICQGTMSHLVSTHMNGRNFELVNEVTCGTRKQTTYTARSRIECAFKCAGEKCCSNFNFGFGQCELMSETGPCRTNATGWTHGFYLTGILISRSICKPVSVESWSRKI